ncbi:MULTISPECIES: Ig-like domain-containing protein [Pandoraea]|uniref:Ig-like domain-containing protein n=1 Tax=Pandoraea TaxID=93217 RepID=UPI001F5DF08D|nr:MULTISPECIES: Ig-like domain-containing protein [Pandoraea]MCI3205535.1 hypothetical protein [Pandoraea sp. LA3]MDN4583563.1 hypothetical protein [Pandoraea capi]
MNFRDSFRLMPRLRTQDDSVGTMVLQAPRVLDAETYGGIGYRSLHNIGQPIVVLVPWSNDFQQNDTLRLYWGLDDVPAAATIIRNVNDASYPLDVPVQHVLDIGDGLIDVWFDQVSNISGEITKSPVVQILVKQTIPGGEDPDQSTPSINENLLKAVLPPGPIEPPIPAEGLPVTIPKWLNMAEGDRLTVYWGSQTLPTVTMQPGDVGNDIVVMVDEETIKEAGDSDKLAVTYGIYDAVTNYSLRAPPAFIEVDVGDAIYTPPALIGAPGNVLDFDGLGGRDATAIVMMNGDLSAGDIVELVFDGRSDDGLPVTFSVTHPWADPMVEFLLPNASLAPVVPGEGSLFYRVTDSGGVSKGRSRRAHYTITGTPQQLAAPVVREAEGDQLDPAKAQGGANVDIEAWAGMAPGDLVMLQWVGTNADGESESHYDQALVEFGQEGEPVHFIVPFNKVLALAGGQVTVSYTVRSGDSFRDSDTLTLSVLETTQLPPPIVQGEVGGELDPALVPDGAKLTIPAWPGMAVGDYATWFWNGMAEGGSASDTVQVSEVGPIEVVVPRAVIEANANGRDRVSVLYQVAPAGGEPLTSLAREFNVLPLGSARLPPPRVEEAIDGILDPDDLELDATVIVEAYEGMARNDVVTIWFAKDSVAEFWDEFKITDNGVGNPVKLYVPRENVERLDGLKIIVTYTVEKEGVITASEDLMIEVSKTIVWPAPTVKEATGDYLPDGAYPRGATMVVTWHTSMRPGDELDIYWGEPPQQYHDGIGIDDPENYEFRIEKDIVDQWFEQQVPVYYTITRGNRVMPSEVLNLRVALAVPNLTAPDVREATQGVLKPIDVRQGATVVISYEGMTADDSIQLDWDGDASFAAVAGDPSGSVTITVPPEKIAPTVGRTIPVKYTVDRNGFGTESPTLNLIVQDFLPGNLPLATVVEQKGGVLSLSDFEGDATARQPAWPLMAEGQRIWWRLYGTQINGNRLTITFESGHAITAAEAGKPLDRLLRRVDLEKLQDGSDFTLEVKVTLDGSPNEADAVVFRVRTLRFSQGLSLPAPEVIGAVNDEIDAIDAIDGVTVQVTYEDMAATDQIELFWDGESVGQVAGDASGSVEIDVVADKVVPYLGKTLPVHYTVTRNAATTPSGVLDLAIDDFDAGELPDPVIPQAANNVLKLSSFQGNAQVTVAPWPAIALGQKYWLRCYGTLENGTEDMIELAKASSVSAAEVTDGLDVAIPRARLEALRDKSDLRVELKVTFDATTDEQRALTFPQRRYTMDLSEAIAIEPGTMTLSGFVVKMGDWTPTGEDADGNTETRQATGGVPPYRYVSSNPRIATVDIDGKVSGERNGSATITVTDQAGSAVSYPVVVSNVYAVIVHAHSMQFYERAHAANWINSVSTARRIGTTEMDIMKKVYTTPFPASSKHYLWSDVQGQCEQGFGLLYIRGTAGLTCVANYNGYGAAYSAWCLVPRP